MGQGDDSFKTRDTRWDEREAGVDTGETGAPASVGDGGEEMSRGEKKRQEEGPGDAGCSPQEELTRMAVLSPSIFPSVVQSPVCV